MRDHRWHPLPEFPQPRDGTADDLMALIEEVSQDYTAAGWLIDCEYGLWAVVCGDKRSWYGFDDPALIQRLKQIAAELGGWIVWRLDENGDPGQSGPEFVPLDEWQHLYAKWSA